MKFQVNAAISLRDTFKKVKKSIFLEYFTVLSGTFLTPLNLKFDVGVVNHFWIAQVKFQVSAVIFIRATSKKIKKDHFCSIFLYLKGILQPEIFFECVDC